MDWGPLWASALPLKEGHRGGSCREDRPGSSHAASNNCYTKGFYDVFENLGRQWFDTHFAGLDEEMCTVKLACSLSPRQSATTLQPHANPTLCLPQVPKGGFSRPCFEEPWREGSVLLGPGCPASGDPGGTCWKKWRRTCGPTSPRCRTAVLSNNILVLSDDSGDSSISDFVEEGSCQPPDLPAEPQLPCPQPHPTPSHPIGPGHVGL